MKSKRTKPIPERKIKSVEELANLMKNKKTILIASIKNLPASQFQEIGKKLRGKAVVKVPKKNIVLRAIDSAGNVKELTEKIQEDTALLFSDLDAFELSADLIENKSPAKAKPGQVAPIDIGVQAGPTELMPGPAVTDLGNVGIQIRIDKGKINIKEPKVIVKEGEKISADAANVMNMLDIKPFSVGFIPVVAFDTKEGKLYSEIKINKEETIEELKFAFGKALPFALEIGYVCGETVKFLISKAGTHEKVLNEKVESQGDSKVDENDNVKADDKVAPADLKDEKSEPEANQSSNENTSENKSEEESK